MKFCLTGIKHIYTKDEWMKVMNNDIVKYLRDHNIETEARHHNVEARPRHHFCCHEVRLLP